MATKLSVNINKIALLRNARGGQVPNLMQFALDCYRFGVDGITIHPRPDERHITQQDVWDLAKEFPKNDCEFNIEGYPSKDFVEMVCKVKPSQVTLVPDAPDQLTSDHGWDTLAHFALLKDVLTEFKAHNIRTSLFIDPIPERLEAAKNAGADRIEYYTGPYAHQFESAQGNMQQIQACIQEFVLVDSLLTDLGLGMNAGHDLNLDNLQYFKQHLPNLLEVSIGQAFVRDCLYFGLENTIHLYKRKLV
jgi:pyridoxine 5-phosphate synthase